MALWKVIHSNEIANFASLGFVFSASKVNDTTIATRTVNVSNKPMSKYSMEFNIAPTLCTTFKISAPPGASSSACVHASNQKTIEPKCIQINVYLSLSEIMLLRTFTNDKETAKTNKKHNRNNDNSTQRILTRHNKKSGRTFAQRTFAHISLSFAFCHPITMRGPFWLCAKVAKNTPESRNTKREKTLLSAECARVYVRINIMVLCDFISNS